MNNQAQTIKPDIQEYKTLLVDLHRLIADGKSDSEEADDVRDRILDIWHRLSEDEIAWLDGVSADLFMLQNDEVFEPSDRPFDRLQSQLRTAFEENDWNRVLTLLRKGIPLPADQLAHLRSICYDRLGHPDLALLFEEHASKLSPYNPLYHVGTLNRGNDDHFKTPLFVPATLTPEPMRRSWR